LDSKVEREVGRDGSKMKKNNYLWWKYNKLDARKTQLLFNNIKNKLLDKFESALFKDENMKKIYVAGAISNPNSDKTLENIRNGIRYSLKLIRKGYLVNCPFLDYSMVLCSESKGDTLLLQKHSIEWLKQCNEMHILPGWEKSKGVKAELKIASLWGITVKMIKKNEHNSKI